MAPALTALLIASAVSLASSSGKTGSTTGCGGCHGSSASSSTSATIATGDTEVGAGESVTVTFAVSSTSSSRTHAGFNLGATAGSFTSGSGSVVSSGELTQSASRAISGSAATWTFTWTAPSAATTVTLRGAGNAVNNDGGTSGDAWARASDLTISVVCLDEDSDGVTTCDGDCDDSDPDVAPGLDETCNGVDDDCDGTVDDSPIDGDTWYTDADADGFGDPAASTVACAQPSGTVADATDCDDSDALTSPTGAEICGGADEDCDGLSDDADPSVTGMTDWYSDADGDGFGETYIATACVGPSATAGASGDCDDDDAGTYPGAPETCTEPVDRNCDGAQGFVDGDADGFAACEECDDADPDRNPDAAEICNDIDDDCDGAVDGRDALGASLWHADLDGDGFGDAASAQSACEAPGGHVADSTDCDDSDPTAFPGAPEAPYDGVDQDCDGGDLCDVDQDGSDAEACGGEDCADDDAAVSPEVVESWYDGVDQDCDGNDDDQDGDGFGVSDDCDDRDPTSFPGDGTQDADCMPIEAPPADPVDGDGWGCGGGKAAALLAPLTLLGLRRRRHS